MAVGVVTTRDPIADGLSWSFHDESCLPLEDIMDFYVAKAFRLDGTTPTLIRICVTRHCSSTAPITSS